MAWGIVPWRLVPERPIFMGEAFYVRGNNPAAFSQFAGEGCFTGWGPATRLGAGLMAKMLAEGYRWHGVAAHHFCFDSEESTDLHYNSWRPVCVFCRQWNWTFGGGSVASRTLKVFNDTHLTRPDRDGLAICAGRPAGGGRAEDLSPRPGPTRGGPDFGRGAAGVQRTAGQFVLTCSRGGKEVFREVKNVAVLAPDSVAKPSLSAGQLAVLDPQGAAKTRLQARGIAFTEVQSLAEVPAQARVVLVGKDALSARDATDPRWLALAARGARLLVLEQANPLHFQALPADLTPTDYVGRVAFLENPEHPLFAGLDQPDFFTWSGDHVVYRNVYKKATRGAVSLAHCDEQLGCSALAECPVNEGLMVLCQMVVGEKLATDPVAQRLFDNLLLYGERYVLVQKNTAVVMDPKSPAMKLLTDSGLKFDAVGDLLAALGDGKHQIVVFDATPENLKTLAGAADRVKAFTAAGGWLMAWGLTPEGLADFNRLVGVEHVLRPFELERVTLPALRDPILSGLTVRDVTLESAEQMFPWAGDKYLVDDEFSYLVDFDDIAPFCDIPGSKPGDHAAARAAGPGWPRNMVNGFTGADGWKLIHYIECDNAQPDLQASSRGGDLRPVDRAEHALRQGHQAGALLRRRSPARGAGHQGRQQPAGLRPGSAQGTQPDDQAGRVRPGEEDQRHRQPVDPRDAVPGLAREGQAATERRRAGEVSPWARAAWCSTNCWPSRARPCRSMPRRSRRSWRRCCATCTPPLPAAAS